ncbi:MAG: hypothetical protein ACFFDT_23140, partial [Candidatus Hodarchaeota archaeon]
LVTLIFILIPKIWEKLHFKGSLEWLVSKILVKTNPNAMDRLNTQGILYDIEPLVTNIGIVDTRFILSSIPAF